MIGYYLHHQGEGHRRRGLAVARELRHHVTGLGSGPVPEAWPGDWVRLERDDDPGVTDPGAADTTAHGTLHWVPRHHPGLLARHRQLVDWLARTRPALLVVDVSVEVCLVARLCGVPVVVAAMPGDRLDRPHRTAYDLAEALLAPWPPGAHPDAGWPQEWREKVWEVGGISALPVGSPAPDRAPHLDQGDVDDRGSGRRVLLLWGRGGADLDPGAVREAQAATPGWRWTVRGGGAPASPDLLAELAEADVVVCHAGQNAVADVALTRRPAVVLGQPRPHQEQEATVRALERLSLAATATGWPAAELWPGLLGRALELGGQGWSAWGGDGAARAAALLDDLADRLCPAPGPDATPGADEEEAPLAVLTLAHGRHDHLRGQVAGLAVGEQQPDLHVVVAMDDPQVRAVAEQAWAAAGHGQEPATRLVVVDLPADPLGLPLARARNLAAATAREQGARQLVFLDVDCIPGPGTVASYARELASPQTRSAGHPAVLCGDVAYLPPLPEGKESWAGPADLARLAQVGRHRPDRVFLPDGRRMEEPDLRQFWSLSFALSTDDFEAAGGFCEDYVGYGGEDTDFAQVVGSRGGSLTWVGGATAYHQHHESSMPPVGHLEAVVRNAGVFADRWGWWPMEGWLTAFRERGLAAPDPSGRWRVLS
ncbi:galactosyltransferase-related protein [Ornithinimicrobium pekingense]|uniref:Galactosyltransferase C-terminal domain-containing protein n=1 Tax=Ornithinimicrobium pekingense TaxID=384677 RepID=A0ABQ2F757_9MICO|nr:galactosyltransferase-related protein [Ornithinimicrobium pekingense]GGK57601.1 hypothetical protein GCM10011509_02530 [Ornithinimicrobium pekingense]